MQIQRLQLRDLTAIEEIERVAYPTPWSRSMFAGELSKPSSICLGAFEDGRLLGYLITSRYVDAWHVMNVAVAPLRQRSGIATPPCSNELFALTRDDDRRGYTLEVRVSNAGAIALYERLGFESRGVRRGYYTDNREDALIMWRDPASGFAMILGLETSCDETAAAVDHRGGRDPLERRRLPDRAARRLRRGRPRDRVAPPPRARLAGRARGARLAGAALDDLDRIAVTRGPGLIGALLVGLAAAKGLAWGRGLPLVPVDHLHGHVASLYLQPTDLEPPFLCLLASGGHTLLLDVQDRSGFRVIGTTLDDAAGEAFDKGARLLGLGYPGGAEIDRVARDGDPTAYDFPVARVPGPRLLVLGGQDGAPLRRPRHADDLDARRADLAASYQRAIVRALVERVREAADGRTTDRDRRRRRRQLRAARRAARGGCRAARALHGQCCDDRLRRPLRRARRRSPPPGRVCGGVARSAWPRSPAWSRPRSCRPGGGGSHPPAPSRLEAAAAWSGLVGSARVPVGTGQRVLVVLTAFSLADRVQRAGGLAGDSDERRWTSAAVAAQQQFISQLGREGVIVKPEFRFTRTFNGFSAVLDPRAIALLERTPGVKGVYPVRVAYPATVPSQLVREAVALAPRPGVRLSGIAGRGVTIALLDTGVDLRLPFLHGHVLDGIDVVGSAASAQAQAKPTDPTELERHGTEMAGLLVGAGGPGGLAGVAPAATVLPIRVAAWQTDSRGDYTVYARTDQLLAGLEHAVDPNGDGDAHDAARIALIPLVEPFAAFTDGPLARAVAGALAAGHARRRLGRQRRAGRACLRQRRRPGGGARRARRRRARLAPRRHRRARRRPRRPERALRPARPARRRGGARRGHSCSACGARAPGTARPRVLRPRCLLVAGSAAVVPAGAEPLVAARAAADAGAAAVILYGRSVAAGRDRARRADRRPGAGRAGGDREGAALEPERARRDRGSADGAGRRRRRGAVLVVGPRVRRRDQARRPRSRRRPRHRGARRPRRPVRDRERLERRRRGRSGRRSAARRGEAGGERRDLARAPRRRRAPPAGDAARGAGRRAFSTSAALRPPSSSPTRRRSRSGGARARGGAATRSSVSATSRRAG